MKSTSLMAIPLSGYSLLITLAISTIMMIHCGLSKYLGGIKITDRTSLKNKSPTCIWMEAYSLMNLLSNFYDFYTYISGKGDA